MLNISEDQFIELVGTELNKHISRDKTIVPADREWENRFYARALSKELRKYGYDLPDVERRKS